MRWDILADAIGFYWEFAVGLAVGTYTAFAFLRRQERKRPYRHR